MDRNSLLHFYLRCRFTLQWCWCYYNIKQALLHDHSDSRIGRFSTFSEWEKEFGERGDRSEEECWSWKKYLCRLFFTSPPFPTLFFPTSILQLSQNSHNKIIVKIWKLISSYSMYTPCKLTAYISFDDPTVVAIQFMEILLQHGSEYQQIVV